MNFGIEGRWALVCGASKGLGFGCARALAREGVQVLMVSRTPADIEAAAQSLREEIKGAHVVALAADITTEQGRAAAFGHAAGPGKDFDIVVTNAGGPPTGDFRDWDRARWIDALSNNMITPIELIKATVDGMAQRGFGRIVNITSGAVKAPIPVLGLSNGARSGLTGFVAGLARSAIAASNVTINNLLPGAVATDRLRTTLAAAAKNSSDPAGVVRDARGEKIPAGRYGSVEEFGATCAFLCSQQAGYITGQNILLDGGAFPGTF